MDKEKIIEMLETVIDPELGVDVWTTGLIYDIDIKSEEEVDITMTYTTPFCPYGEQLKGDVMDSLQMLGFQKVNIKVTFEPPWQPSAELRAAMGV